MNDFLNVLYASLYAHDTSRLEKTPKLFIFSPLCGGRWPCRLVHMIKEGDIYTWHIAASDKLFLSWSHCFNIIQYYHSILTWKLPLWSRECVLDLAFLRLLLKALFWKHNCELDMSHAGLNKELQIKLQCNC